MRFEPRYSEDNVNVPSHHHFREFLCLSLGLLGIVFAVYLALGLAAEKIAERLSPGFEAALAGEISARFAHDDFPRTSAYLQKILDTLVASAAGLPEFPYKVSVHDEAAVNALALPAGNIVVFKGLLAEIKSENEVAMILAHELGHYAHRDHLRGLGRGLVMMSILTALGVSGDLPGFVAPSLQTFDLKHSRTQESAADHFALDLMARAYGHVGGALEVFQTLADQEKGRQGPEFFSTHPDTLWRREALASTSRSKKYPTGAVRPLPESGVLPFPGDKGGNKQRQPGAESAGKDSSH